MVLVTQLTPGLTQEIADWGCAYMSILAAIQINNNKALKVDRINELFDASKKANLIGYSGYINDYYGLCGYLQQKIGLNQDLKVVGTKDNNGTYMYPAFSNLSSYSYAVTTYKVKTSFGQHIVLCTHDYSGGNVWESVIYNPNPDIDLIESQKSVLINKF